MSFTSPSVFRPNLGDLSMRIADVATWGGLICCGVGYLGPEAYKAWVVFSGVVLMATVPAISLFAYSVAAPSVGKTFRLPMSAAAFAICSLAFVSFLYTAPDSKLLPYWGQLAALAHGILVYLVVPALARGRRIG